jgi:Tfp pilus assembly pilus retraction ATPase PilT
MVPVTGIGSGKSTPATLIHEINQHRAAHILSIGPVEFVRAPNALISHRELGTDVPTSLKP